jgi:hypothetical protein
MIRRATLLVLALSALFALQFADCLPAVSADDQTMQCCGSMPCDPTNQSHDCCKKMAPADSSNVLPAQHSTLSVLVTAVSDHFSMPEVPILMPVSRVRSEAPQHSPPELYTLHSSLLI